MVTDVIIRFDDIRGPDLVRLAEWFDAHHPEVPCAVFTMATDSEWDRRSWQCAKHCIEQRDWEVGGHTREHPLLSQLSEAEITEAIRTNVADIESGLATVGLTYSVETFAYPGGDHDDRVVAALEAEDIPNGLTFTDGFPYQSVDAVPTGDDRRRWGVTHNGEFDICVWNDRFDRVAEQDGLYVLGLHPTYWENKLFDPIIRYLYHDVSRSYLRRNLRHGLKRKSKSSRWETLDEHIRYIKDYSKVQFTTFRECVETPDS
jgi:peptidoglycan/xylan/chitin deacetylase (PgdA/CDA1 family)